MSIVLPLVILPCARHHKNLWSDGFPRTLRGRFQRRPHFSNSRRHLRMVLATRQMSASGRKRTRVSLKCWLAATRRRAQRALFFARGSRNTGLGAKDDDRRARELRRRKPGYASRADIRRRAKHNGRRARKHRSISPDTADLCIRSIHGDVAVSRSLIDARTYESGYARPRMRQLGSLWYGGRKTRYSERSRD